MSSPAPATGTIAVPAPDTKRQAKSSNPEGATAAVTSPAAASAVPTSTELRVPTRSTTTPAGIRAIPAPRKFAVRTAPSSGRLRPYSSRSSGPIAGRPKLTNETAAWAALATTRMARAEGGRAAIARLWCGDGPGGDRASAAPASGDRGARVRTRAGRGPPGPPRVDRGGARRADARRGRLRLDGARARGRRAPG